MLGAVGGDGRDELEAGSHRPFGVVLLCDRGAPDRHDGIADELLDDAAVAADDGPGELEVARQDLSYLLGVAFLRERREADEVAEQHRDVAELGGGRDGLLRRRSCDDGGGLDRRRGDGGSDRCRALTAEPVVRLKLRTTRRAHGGERSGRSSCRTVCRPGSRLHTLGSASIPSSACLKATTPQVDLHPPGHTSGGRGIERSGTTTGITDSHIQNHARPSEAWFEVLLRSRRSVLAPKGASLVVRMPTDQRLPRLRRSQACT